MKRYYTIVTALCITTYEPNSRSIKHHYTDGTEFREIFKDSETALEAFKKLIR